MKPSLCAVRPTALGLLGLVLLSGCGRHGSTVAEPPAPEIKGDAVIFPAQAPQLASITVEPAAARTLALTHLTGRLTWDDDVTVRVFTPVAGRVLRVLADVGQPIAANQALAEISSPDYGQALADARTAEANLAEADKAFARSRDLLDHGAAAVKDVEAAEAAYRAALAERDRAESRLALYGGRSDETGERYLLRSPLAGTLVERTITPGQEVRADQMLANAPELFAPLFVVSDPRRLWLQLDVGEADIPELSIGQRLIVRAPGFPDRTFDGVLDRIGDELDPSTRTLKVRAVVDNPQALLKAEEYVSVDALRTGSDLARAGVEVPSKSVFMLGDHAYLFVATAPGTFVRTEVQVGTEKDGHIPVLSGVSAGQGVVTEGALLLQSVLEPAD